MLPLYDLDTDHHQQYWLGLFLALIWTLTAAAICGVTIIASNRDTMRWVLLLSLLIVPRLVFLAAQEHPEGRYTVEFFPLVIAAGSLAVAAVSRRKLHVVHVGSELHAAKEL